MKSADILKATEAAAKAQFPTTLQWRDRVEIGALDQALAERSLILSVVIETDHGALEWGFTMQQIEEGPSSLLEDWITQANDALHRAGATPPAQT